jgi:FkbM family methyltransferase
MDFFQKCYEKHSFNELNSIDLSMLSTYITYFFEKFGKNDNSIYFDVGCNSGSFIRVLESNNIKNNIHCFEPHPVISKDTKEKYPYVNMNNYCLGNYMGNIDIYIPMWSVGLSSNNFRPVFNQLNQEIKTLNVYCNTIDNYCIENNIDTIDFIKIDVEGSEKKILEGATNMLKNKKIKCGIFEVGSTLTDAGTSTDEICQFLENNGYTIIKRFSSDYLFHI